MQMSDEDLHTIKEIAEVMREWDKLQRRLIYLVDKLHSPRKPGEETFES